jgi:Uma2 family endonuclease
MGYCSSLQTFEMSSAMSFECSLPGNTSFHGGTLLLRMRTVTSWLLKMTRCTMATESVSRVDLQPLPAELHPKVDHLVTEDDTPVDNIFSEKQQRLLVEPLYSCWQGPGQNRSFIALSNVGLFFGIRQPPFVPDMLLSLDVRLPADLWPKSHRSYFVWEFGKPPDVVVEVVSNREGGEDSDKWVGYARIGVHYYVIYDPEKRLGENVLQAFQLEGMAYRPLDEPIGLPGVELGLRLWQGVYEDHENTWLRWADAEGQLIPTGAEQSHQQRQRAEQEQQRADQEQQRAEQQQQRADRLAEQLRRLGAEPEE